MSRDLVFQDLKERIEELEARETAFEAFSLLQRENEDLFRAIIDNIPVMIDAFDERGTCTLWNKECEKVFGWSRADMFSSKDPLALLYPDPDLRARILREKLQADGSFNEYTVNSRASGLRTQLWANFRLPSGAIISVGQDVTRINTMLESLRKSEQHFRDLVENSPTGISIIQDGRIVYRNPEQQKIFGSLPEGRFPLMNEKIHPEDEDKFTELYTSTLAGNSPPAGLVLRFIRLVGENGMKWLHCRSSLIEYQKGTAVLVNMMDVTKAREVLRLLDIRDRMASLGHMAAGIAHEIRNPLSGINIYLDAGLSILDQGGDTETLREILMKIQSASLKIESVIKRVLDFSRPLEKKLVPTDIRKPIEEALALSSVTLRKTGISIGLDLADDLPLCLADSQLIEHVILNLVTNAADAMKDMEKDKRIVVRTWLKGSKIRVSVADSGHGVDPGLVRKIFDPFFTTKSSSTGIGLSLCQRIVHDHGGSIGVSAGSLGGAEFTFTIPLYKEDGKP